MHVTRGGAVRDAALRWGGRGRQGPRWEKPSKAWKEFRAYPAGNTEPVCTGFG